MNKIQFNKIIRANKKELETWDKWKRDLVINAKNISSGNFYEKEGI